MSRDEAIKELKEPMYNEKEMDDYICIIKKQLGLNDVEFDNLIKAPIHEHNDYKIDFVGDKIRKLF